MDDATAPPPPAAAAAITDDYFVAGHDDDDNDDDDTDDENLPSPTGRALPPPTATLIARIVGLDMATKVISKAMISSVNHVPSLRARDLKKGNWVTY